MKDWLTELVWAIVHDEDTKIILSIIISCVAIGISIAVLVANATAR